MELLIDYISNIGNQFIDPKKRVFIFYIFCSFIIALLWFIFNKKLTFKKAFVKILDRKIFFSKSAKSDYKVFLINQLIMMLISPLLITQLTISPKRKTKEEILIACVKELLNEKIIPSNGWVLKTVIGVRTVAEW